ncbi:MAG: protein-disulfide reductase DsbD domain-containing protein [Pseudomonadota bacterium]
MTHWLFVIFAAAVVLINPSRAQLFSAVNAQTDGLSAVAETERARSAFAPERAGFAPGETTWFVFRQNLADGWHVYWRNPGDSGLPLEFAWELPEGYQTGEILYPPPERTPVGDYVNFGHHHDPVFLAPVTAPANAAPGDVVPVKVTATWLICEEICVPETAIFEMSVPVLSAPPFVSTERAYADDARATAPAPHVGASTLYVGGDAPVLVVEDWIEDARNAEGAFIFPDKEGFIAPAALQITASVGSDAAFQLTPAEEGASFLVLDALTGVVGAGVMGEVPSDYRTVSAAIIDEPAPTPVLKAISAAMSSSAVSESVNAVSGTASGFFLLALAAFFGGALLNVMPCVFPILFIKAAGFIEASGDERSRAGRHAAAYVGGVVATFLSLGAALLILRAGGAALGWGFHLQSPIVVALSAYVLFLVALNLAGVFELGSSLQNVGGGLAEKKGLAGAFFTGVLAVFVAAPCIGPLLSAPMGAAVFLPPALGMAMFALMALGLAAPYALLTTIPALARALPRPGPWMAIMKHALAFPVLGAAAYFVWVLAAQTGGPGLARGFFGLIVLAFAAWLFGLSQKGARGAFLPVLALAASVLALAPIGRLELIEDGADGSSVRGGYGGLEAIAWSDAAIAEHRALGEGVFVDFTAAWCVTCQFNKATILSRRSVAKLFDAHNVRLMAADWTRRDPKITEALQGFGASGVPLYVYYPPQGAPQVLSLPLTERGVAAAFASGAGDVGD